MASDACGGLGGALGDLQEAVEQALEDFRAAVGSISIAALRSGRVTPPDATTDESEGSSCDTSEDVSEDPSGSPDEDPSEDSSAESETDIDDKLSDEELEQVLDGGSWARDSLSHADRVETRERLRRGETVPWVERDLADERAANDSENAWWPDGETEAEALEAEKADEEADERATLARMVADARCAAGLAAASWPVGAELEALPAAELEAELEAAERVLDERDAAAADADEAAAMLADMVALLDDDAPGPARARAEAALRAHDEAGARDTAAALWAAVRELRGLYSAAAADTPERRRKRRCIEIVEVRDEQRRTDPILDRKSVRELVNKVCGAGDSPSSWRACHFSDGAIDALRAAAEAYLVEVFSGAGLAARQARPADAYADDADLRPEDIEFHMRNRMPW